MAVRTVDARALAQVEVERRGDAARADPHRELAPERAQRIDPVATHPDAGGVRLLDGDPPLEAHPTHDPPRGRAYTAARAGASPVW